MVFIQQIHPTHSLYSLNFNSKLLKNEIHNKNIFNHDGATFRGFLSRF